jgi:hypothetical protein
MQANRAFVDLLDRVAERRQATPAQIALAWRLGQSRSIVPIPGTRRLHRLDENAGSADIDLTADDLAETRSGRGDYRDARRSRQRLRRIRWRIQRWKRPTPARFTLRSVLRVPRLRCWKRRFRPFTQRCATAL